MRKFTLTLATIAMCIGVSTTPAVAETSDNLNSMTDTIDNTIIFADSLYANPARRMNGNNAVSFSPHAKDGGLTKSGCPKGEQNIGVELQKYTDSLVTDYSCAGGGVTVKTGATDFDEMIDKSIHNGDLNETTRQVIISIGMVDFNPFGSSGARNIDLLHPDQVTDEFVSIMGSKIDVIKKLAPNATITIITYPSISAENRALCPIRTPLDNGNVGVALDSTMHTYEDRTHYALWRTSQEKGTDYYNLREDTKWNNMCAPDDIRYISGVAEESMEYNMTNHLTNQGVVEVGKLIADNVLVE